MLRAQLPQTKADLSTYSVPGLVDDVLAPLSDEAGRTARVNVEMAPNVADMFGDRSLLLKTLLPLVRRAKRSTIIGGRTVLPITVRRSN